MDLGVTFIENMGLNFFGDRSYVKLLYINLHSMKINRVKGLVLTNIIGNVVSRDQMDLGITFIENMGLDFFRDHSYSNSTHTFVLADYYYFYFFKKLINI